MMLLWENASPTSDFDAQKISIDLSSYSAVLIKTRYYSGQSYLQDYTPKFAFSLKGHKTMVHGFFGTGQFRIYEVSDTGIDISSGYQVTTSNNTPTVNKASYAPISIYGIKGISVTG